MKKIIALALVLLIPYIAMECRAEAEQSSFQIEGEWYCVALRTRMMCYNANLKEDGCYYVNLRDGEDAVFREQGKIDFIHTEEWTDHRTNETHRETETDTITAKYCRLSDDAILYYDVIDNELSGYYICFAGDEWKAYFLDSTSMVLFLNGKATSYNGNSAADYLVSGNSMYMAHDNQYVRGRIEQQGDSAFIYYIDADSEIVTYGETEVDYGTPFCLFISTSIMK